MIKWFCDKLFQFEVFKNLLMLSEDLLYILYFFYTYIAMIKFNLQIRHSKTLIITIIK